MYFRILAGFLAGVIFFGGVLGVAEATSSGDYDPYPATPEEIAAGAQTSSNSNDRVAKTSDEVVREEKARIAAEAAEQAKIDKEAEDFKKRINGIKYRIEGKSTTASEPEVVAIGKLDLSNKKILRQNDTDYDEWNPAKGAPNTLHNPKDIPIEVEIDRVKKVLDVLADKEQMEKWKKVDAAQIQKCLKSVLLKQDNFELDKKEKDECISSKFIEQENSTKNPTKKEGIAKISHYLGKSPTVTPILPRIEEFEKQAREWQNLLEDLQVLGADLDNSEVLGEGVTENPAKTAREDLTSQIIEIKTSILTEFNSAVFTGTTNDQKIEELKEKINDYLEKVAIQRMRANSLRLMLEHDETIRALWNTVDNSRGFSVSGVLSVGNEADWELVSVDPESRTNILAYLIRLALQVIGTFAILMLVVGGYLMMTALNDDNRLQKGKTIVITTIAGLIIAFLSYLIVKVLFAFMF